MSECRDVSVENFGKQVLKSDAPTLASIKDRMQIAGSPYTGVVGEPAIFASSSSRCDRPKKTCRTQPRSVLRVSGRTIPPRERTSICCFVAPRYSGRSQRGSRSGTPRSSKPQRLRQIPFSRFQVDYDMVKGFERSYALSHTQGRIGPKLAPGFLQPNIDEANQKQEFAQTLTCSASFRSWSSSVLPVTRLRGFRS